VRCGDASFATTVGGKQVVVTPSDALAAGVEKIIQTFD
jgi:hypothetical protein